MNFRHGIDLDRASALFEAERSTFVARMPGSRALSERGARHLLFGVPLHWMNDWPTPFALHVESAQGARVRDVDGHELIDFCLGDTGAMFGHSPPAVVRAIQRQAGRGLTTMLPTEDAAVVAEELAHRFGLPFWQFAMTASDANRFVIRWARAATGRQKILVFNGCYHGTVDDVFVDLVDGLPVQRDSLLGQVHELTRFTRVVEFNDLPALEAALQAGDVACVLAEPVMTNIGMVLPQPGFWTAAQELTRRHGTLLAMDETHTISSGAGGWCGAQGLVPDIFVLGKPVAGGLPCAVYGFSEAVATRAQRAKREAPPGHSGIGTTLSANMLAMAALRASLTEVMTDAACAHMTLMAQRLAEGLAAVIRRQHLPWCVTQVGARTEVQFAATPPTNGTEAGAALCNELERALHLFLLNRGVLITPFHNMMLVCPDTGVGDVDRLVALFDEAVTALRAAT